MRTKRIVYLEVIRIVACFLVIYNHTEENGYLLWQNYEFGSIQNGIYMIVSLLCKMAVPLFLCVSGVLLLGKEEPLIVVYKKRIGRMVIVLVLVSMAYYLLSGVLRGYEPFDITYFIRELYTNNLKVHLWYIYMYLSFLISLPLLRILANALDAKMLNYLVILAIMFLTVIPLFDYAIWKGTNGHTGNLSINWLTTSIVLYPIMGFGIHKFGNRISIKNVVLLLIEACIATILAYFINVHTMQLSHEIKEANASICEFLNCVSGFVVIKFSLERIKLSERIEKAICSLGESVFGIYLCHMVVKDIIKETIYVMHAWGINKMIAIMIYCCIVMGLGYLIVQICKKIPIMKMLL